MTLRKVAACVIAVLGVITAAASVFLAISYRNEKPILMEEPVQARNTADAFMTAVCDSDFTKATQMIYGQPELGVDQESNDLVGQLFWDAYWDRINFELVGDCYVTEEGVCQEVSMTYLDISNISEKLRQRSMTILQERIAQATDTSEIYDENNDYREDLVMSVLNQAAQEVVAEADTVTVVFSLNMRHVDGQWMIIADKELIDTLFFGCIF